jgi:hypothetical protein
MKHIGRLLVGIAILPPICVLCAAILARDLMRKHL